MFIKKIRKEEKGAVMVLFALLLVVLMGFTAFAVDLGIKYLNDNKAQQVADAAALAAANYLPDMVEAKKQALKYIEANGLDPEKVEITFLDGGAKIDVHYKTTVDTKFANVLGIKKMGVNKKSVAQAGTPESNRYDFDYAIFSGNSNANLGLNNGTYYAEGKVHSNGTMTIHTYAKATSFTANDSGSIDNYNVKYLTKTSDSTYVESGQYDSNKPKDSPEIEMPYYLGKNIEHEIPDTIPLPGDSYWKSKVTTNSMMTDYDGGKAAKASIEAGLKTKINYTSGEGWFGYALNANADIYFACSRNVRFQPNLPSVINGDIYITNDNPSSGSVDFYFPWSGGSVINGNIYCLSGDLCLGNVTVNGNIYCAGKLTTDGGKNTKINAKYVYADSILINNDVEVSGIVCAEHDIAFYGGSHDFSSSNTLSIYSKKGNISFGAWGSKINGIIFAPYGNIKSVGDCEVHGRIIGDTISLATGNVIVKVPPNDLGFDIKDPEAPATVKKPTLVDE